MSMLPAGTVTFLFTDIEGSTQLWQQYPAAMEAVLSQHHAILQDAIESHGGYVFQIVGDAVNGAFQTAGQAVAAALAAQRSFLQPMAPDIRVRVRMGIHTGSAEAGVFDERAGGYSGYLTLTRAQRIMSVAHGAQVLLSQVSRDLVVDSLPADVSLRDLGERQLKDLIRPERLYQLVAPQLPSVFPPLKTMDARPNNLPYQTTAFIGRGSQVRQVKAKLLQPDVRLLTLTGVGGTGKTRLALQVAADAIEAFEDGVFFVGLSPIADAALVPQTVAQSLGLRESPGESWLAQLKNYLREKEMLLLLDNFEQVIAAAATVTELLTAAPRVKVLVTTRTVMHVYGEVVYDVLPLTMPDPKSQGSLGPASRPPLGVTHYEAVELFRERARAVKQDFVINDDNAAAVAEICYRLDGLPLAIELAAARVRVLTPQKMLAQLGQRLRFLTGGPRDLPSRQQTLRNAIDWSYGLLTPQQQALFRRVAVFVGGCTLEPAEAVCNLDGTLDVMSEAQALVDHSLLKQEQEGDEVRFNLLETIREYAQEKLQESGENEILRGRHLGYLVQFAESAEPKTRGREQTTWYNRLDREHDNLRYALEWAQSRSVEQGLRLAWALFWFWYVRGYWGEGREQLWALLTRAEAVDPLMRVRAVLAEGALLGALGDAHAALAQLKDGVARARALGPEGNTTLILGLHWLGQYSMDQDLPAAQAAMNECVALARQVGEPWYLGQALSIAGRVQIKSGQFAEARASLEECIRLCERLGNYGKRATAKADLAHLLMELGEDEIARISAEEALATFRENGHQYNTAFTLGELGDIAARRQHVPDARAAYLESIELWRKLGDREQAAATLVRLGLVVWRQNDGATAKPILEQALALFRELGHTVSANAPFAPKWGDQRDVAIAFMGWAGLALADGKPAHAATLLGFASQWLESAPLKPTTDYEFLSAWVQAEGRRWLGDADYQSAWTKGHALSLEQAVDLALIESRNQ